MTGTRTDGLVVVAATDREAASFRERGLRVVVSGVGRVNAAVATTLAITSRANPPLIISAGIAGALPSPDDAVPVPAIGSIVIGSRAVYAEEGMITREGFTSISEMGFPVATFAEGNSIPADPDARDRLAGLLPDAIVGSIATVATCSGTDGLAMQIADRTGAIAEAMEGAAVLHAAGLLGAPALEIRTISNRTGERERQGWDLEAAFTALDVVASAIAAP